MYGTRHADEHVMKITTNETGTRRIASLTGADIADLLKANGEARAEMGVDATTKLDVEFRVPSGGDYSGMQIDIDASDPILVSWCRRSASTDRDDAPFTAAEVNDVLETWSKDGICTDALIARGWTAPRASDAMCRMRAAGITTSMHVSAIIKALAARPATPVPAPKPAASITFTIYEVDDILDARMKRDESTLLDYGWKPDRIEAYRALVHMNRR